MWLGVFVVAGSLIGLIALVWLGTADWFTRKSTYVTYFNESVQGLNIDSPVRFRGVVVGKVARLGIAPDQSLIEVTMNLAPDFKVKDDLRAQLALTGITGLRFIELDFAQGDALSRHPEVRFPSHYPVIPSVPGGFEEISQSLREIYARLLAVDTEGISRRTVIFLDRGARALSAVDSLARSPALTGWAVKLGRTADHADSLIRAMDGHRYNRELDSTLVQLRQGSRDFREMMSTLRAEAGRLRLGEQSDSLFAHADGLVRSSREAVDRSQYGVLQTLNRMNATMEAMDAAITQMNSLMLSLETYPSNVIYAAPPEKEK